MRAFENRADTDVVDEPLYGPYLAATGSEHPVAGVVIAEQGADAGAALERTAELAAASGCAVQFEKHKAHHLLDAFPRAWMRDVRHAFLVRDPRAVLARYAGGREEVRRADLGLDVQVELFEYVRDELGQAPPVVLAEELLHDPRRELERLCAGLGLAFDEAMLSWPAGRRDTDGVWAGWWYDKLMRSGGFFPFKPREGELPPDLEALACEVEPLYATLRTAAGA